MKTLLKQIAAIIVIVGFAFSIAIVFDVIHGNSNLPARIWRNLTEFACKQIKDASETAAATAAVAAAIPEKNPPAVQASIPIRLKIPRINIDASIERVGLTPDGAMDVPKNTEDAAWFDKGPLPGENGNAVIAGHFGWKDGEAAAFNDLNKLRKGDILYVTNDTGTITTFVVREKRDYDPEADAGDVFNSNDGKSHLNLITCEGVWDKVSKSYSKRLVVFADKE